MSDATDPQHHDHRTTVDPRYGDQPHGAPLASGSPETESGHNDAETATAADGPHGEPTDGAPGATGVGKDDDQGQSQEGGAISGMLKGTVSSLGDTLRNLVRSEVELAKSELRQEASQVGKAGGMIAGGGVLGLTGFTFLMWGLIYLLARKLPMWASASLVGSALVTIAAIFGMSGKTQLQQSDFKPDQTIVSLKRSKDTAADAVSSARDNFTEGSA